MVRRLCVWFVAAFSPAFLLAFVPIVRGQAADFCWNAPVVGQGVHSFDLTGMANDAGVDCDDTPNAPDAFLEYRPSVSGIATIQTCNNVNGDSVLSVHGARGIFTCGTVLFCNDDFCGPQSRIDLPVCAGQSLLIRIAGRGGEEISGEIEISVVPGGQPPDNNLCANAFTIGDESVSYTNCGATNDGPTSCGPYVGDVWYLYIASCHGTATASIDCSTITHDAVIAVYNTPCNGTLIACGTDYPFCIAPYVNFPVIAGGQYLIQIAGSTSSPSRGTGILTLSCQPRPGDRCSEAIPVTPGVTPFNTAGFVVDGVTSCVPANPPSGGDIFFLYRGRGCRVIANTCGSTFDTVLSVFRACNGTEIACNDNFCSGQSSIDFSADNEENYFIRIAGRNGASGSGVLNINEFAANDECPNALFFGPGVISFNTNCATSSFGGCDYPGRDVWFEYTPFRNGISYLTTCNRANFDTVLSAYTACGGTLIACNDNDPGCGLFSSINFPVSLGSTYFLKIDGATASDFGLGGIGIVEADPCHWGRACVADVDDGTGTGTPDSGVTIDDLLFYLAIFDDGTICADVDDGSGTGTRDGGVTIDDLLFYLDRFDQGC